MKNSLLDKLKSEVLLFDGALGTMMHKECSHGKLPELLNIENPDLIVGLHRQYVEAGSDIISANTFGANELKLEGSGYCVESVIQAAIKNARQAGASYVALDVGPLGTLLKPTGTLGFEDAVGLFAKQIIAGEKFGADMILIETMSDLYELKAAIIAAKENSSLPIAASLTYEENLHTFMGVDAATAVAFLDGIGVDVIGVNCSRNPFDISPIVTTYLASCKAPVLVMPNAGMPTHLGDYSISPEQFCCVIQEYYRMGASIFGGCCGTTPEYIRALRSCLSGKKPIPRTVKEQTAITSGGRAVVFGEKVVVVGERINPTGKPSLKDALRNRDMGFIVREAIAQEDAGADALDVNCGLADIDEPVVMTELIERLQSVVKIPLQIDSSNPLAIERAVRIYNGKPLINSVNGSEGSMAAIFPIAKKYGAVVVGLTLDESGIPRMAEERFKIAMQIVSTAARFGIRRQDIIIDCLVLTASAQQAEVFETIKAIKLIKERLGVNTCLGVSNVSYGLPNRQLLNSTFLISALASGLSAAILNPLSQEVVSAIKAFNVLSNTDKGASEYISYFTNVSEAISTAAAHPKELNSLIMLGQRDEAVVKTKELLSRYSPLEVIDGHLVPALELVGSQYERGKLYLPQLIQAAEASRACFDIVREGFPSGRCANKGRIILATVRGDIHDIGKNIAKVLLESYGFDIIDLGKDVDPETIAAMTAFHGVRLVGLSALMTTTIAAMKESIEKIRATKSDCRIMVGGAVLNDEYARFVGADFYAADAMAGVKIAQKLFSK